MRSTEREDVFGRDTVVSPVEMRVHEGEGEFEGYIGGFYYDQPLVRACSFSRVTEHRVRQKINLNSSFFIRFARFP